MHFTITQSSGDKKYLSSLQYKVNIMMINSRNFQSFNMEIRNNQKENQYLFRNAYAQFQDYPSSQFKSMTINAKFYRQMLEYIYDDIIKKFHQQFLDDYWISDDFIQIEKKIEIAKRNIKLERLEFYISTFFHHLRIDGTNLEIEIYKKLSIVADNDKADDSAQQAKRSIIKYVNTFNKECLRLENYEFRLLFQKIRPKMLLQMFVSLLHERKIIIIHNDISKNAVLIEALISLLYPLQWNFTNISYLIPSMVEYLEAPFPYIVGVPRDLWKYIYEQKWDILGEEVVAFDIDNQRIYEKEDLPEFPQPYTQLLIKQLEIQLDKSRSVGNLGKAVTEETKREEDKFWNNFTLKVKQQFLNFLIFLINTFENFYIQNKNSPNRQSLASLVIPGTAASTIDSTIVPPGPLHNNQGSANDIFNFDEYVQNVTENQSFFQKFVRTQAFINFIEQAFYEEQGNLSDASIRFFKECTRKLSKESIQAVRAMQDTMISGLMHKFNNRGISYSIDKCHLIYEQNLKMIQKIQKNEAITQKYSAFGVIQRFDHQRIIPMTPFDPKFLIEKQYNRSKETIYDVKALEQQRSGKKTSSFYNEFMKDLQIEQPPQNYKKTQLTEYFTVQATPSNGIKAIVEFQDQEINQENLNKSHQLIKIEDNLEEASNQSYQDATYQIEEQQNEYDSEEKEPGFFGFFKKTFSSVRKTFESTFNKNQLKSKSHSRPPSGQTHLTQRRQGANTPAIENPTLLDQSKDFPKQKRVTQQKVNARSARSQTFHVKIDKEKDQSQEQLPRRERKNNNSFFANLLNMGSNNKRNLEKSSLSPTKEDLKNQTLDVKAKKKLLNGSGFFVFNEEDMKSMTEMSPKQNFRQKSTTAINVAKSQSFHIDYQLIGNQLSQRQQPVIKATTPAFDPQGLLLAARMRSISYQNHQRVNNGSKPQIKLIDLINESMNNSQIIEENPQSYNTQDITGSKSNRITFAANSENMLSPCPKFTESKNTNQPATENSNPQVVFNLNDMQSRGVKSFRQTPLYSNQFSAQKDKSLSCSKQNEFEEVYKKSTENLFVLPPARNLENGYKEKYNIWKSQSGKVNISGISGQGSGPSKPPKAQQKEKVVLKKQNGHNYKALTNVAKDMQKQTISPKVGKIGSQKDDTLLLQKSIGSDMYNDRNSTDEEMKAPIMGKNLNQFKNIMQQSAKPFEKQNIINSGGNLSNKKNMSSSSQASSSMKNHKRQVSNGMQSAQIKGEVNNVGSPLLENIEPDEDNKHNQRKALQIENMQIGRLRKKSNNNKASQISANNKHSQISQRKQSTGNQKQLLKNNQNKTNTTIHQRVKAKPRPSHHNSNNNLNALKQQQMNTTKEEKFSLEGTLNEKILSQSIQAKNVQSNGSSYSSCPSKTSLISSNQNEQLAAINSSKIEITRQVKRFEELSEDNYISNGSQSEVQNTKSYINIVNCSIDLRDSKKGEFLRLRSQAEVISPGHKNASNFAQKFTPSIANNNTQFRIHSLSQYANIDSNHYSVYAANRPQGMSNDLRSNKIQSSSIIESYQMKSDEILNQQSISNFKNHQKPLNKICWEAFSQIAKLSGDVDHEPHTPRSAGVQSEDEEDMND